jgi:hypothetical protein
MREIPCIRKGGCDSEEDCGGYCTDADADAYDREMESRVDRERDRGVGDE